MLTYADVCRRMQGLCSKPLAAPYLKALRPHTYCMHRIRSNLYVPHTVPASAYAPHTHPMRGRGMHAPPYAPHAHRIRTAYAQRTHLFTTKHTHRIRIKAAYTSHTPAYAQRTHLFATTKTVVRVWLRTLAYTYSPIHYHDTTSYAMRRTNK